MNRDDLDQYSRESLFECIYALNPKAALPYARKLHGNGAVRERLVAALVELKVPDPWAHTLTSMATCCRHFEAEILGLDGMPKRFDSYHIQKLRSVKVSVIGLVPCRSETVASAKAAESAARKTNETDLLFG